MRVGTQGKVGDGEGWEKMEDQKNNSPHCYTGRGTLLCRTVELASDVIGNALPSYSPQLKVALLPDSQSKHVTSFEEQGA